MNLNIRNEENLAAAAASSVSAAISAAVSLAGSISLNGKNISIAIGLSASFGVIVTGVFILVCFLKKILCFTPRRYNMPLRMSYNNLLNLDNNNENNQQNQLEPQPQLNNNNNENNQQQQLEPQPQLNNNNNENNQQQQHEPPPQLNTNNPFVQQTLLNERLSAPKHISSNNIIQHKRPIIKPTRF